MDAEALLIASSFYARFVLGGVLLWAGISKLKHSAVFAETISTFFGLMPRWVAVAAARAIPPVESGLGVLLIIGLGTRWSSAAAFLLLGCSTLVIIVLLVRGHRPHCYCFGRSGVAISSLTIYRNISLIVLTLLIVSVQEVPLSIDMLLRASESPVISLEQVGLTGLLVIPMALAWSGIYEAVNSLKAAEPWFGGRKRSLRESSAGATIRPLEIRKQEPSIAERK